MTAGSDNHHSPIAEPYGVELDEKLTCILDYARILRNREPVRMHIPEDRFIMPEWELTERYRAFRLNDAEEMIPMEDGPWNP